MILHILNHPPENGLVGKQAIRAMGEEDCLLLIEDAVQAVLLPKWDAWHELDGRVYFLEEDAEARGLNERANQLPHCRGVDMPGFVTLTAQADKTITWF